MKILPPETTLSEASFSVTEPPKSKEVTSPILVAEEVRFKEVTSPILAAKEVRYRAPSPLDLSARTALRARQAFLVARALGTVPNVFITINVTCLPLYKSPADIGAASDHAFKNLDNLFRLAGITPTYIAIPERPKNKGTGYHWHSLVYIDRQRLDDACFRIEDRFRDLCGISVADWNARKAGNFAEGDCRRLPIHISTNQTHAEILTARRVGLSVAEAETKLVYSCKTVTGTALASINGILLPLSEHRADPDNHLPEYQASADRPGRRIRMSNNLNRSAAKKAGFTTEEDLAADLGWMDSAERARRASRPVTAIMPMSYADTREHYTYARSHLLPDDDFGILPDL
ncbi:hypothetical protein HN018_13175 [Lichenicola cladoniae]|uniref:Uncharacterized protein n=1 Tax=Lichenicola cladoniae TaxID=1484109 RepID=A0A6M8HQV9_9PROT|nr:hypothetical protein [Lichenicola cladoniae]NPD69031.1 hypothetical protein [Acetobacteraceae bacterium]QKE90863.1 hypothetical protein HN018_13175 [Lichenicola cladoniae]